MKAVIYSLGCKVNQYEGQSIMAQLSKSGLELSEHFEFADIYIINTCSVTGEADRKSRQMVGKALRLNPNAKIYVCGCSSQNDSKVYMAKQNVCFVSGTAGKMNVANMVLNDISSMGKEQVKTENVLTHPTAYEDNLFPKQTKTRGFIKVQDGCNNFCSYCIVPYLRGRSRSRSIDSILTEAQELSKTCKEIVITGINISDYGQDIQSSLIDLVKALKSVPVRKRFGSLECSVLTEDLLENMSGFCDHFHLSLQSGSDSVLKRMNRHYNTNFFLSKVQLLRKFFPNAGITTDLITGFGEETEAEHAQTLEFIQKVGFSDIHIFPYSEREGTVACRLNQVQKSVRVRRAQEASTVRDKMKQDFLTAMLGKSAEVYCEEQDGDYFVGYTPNYIKVYSKLQPGEMKKLKLTELFKDGVVGKE